jgi:hypothetical protein
LFQTCQDTLIHWAVTTRHSTVRMAVSASRPISAVTEISTVTTAVTSEIVSTTRACSSLPAWVSIQSKSFYHCVRSLSTNSSQLYASRLLSSSVGMYPPRAHAGVERKLFNWGLEINYITKRKSRSNVTVYGLFFCYWTVYVCPKNDVRKMLGYNYSIFHYSAYMTNALLHCCLFLSFIICFNSPFARNELSVLKADISTYMSWNGDQHYK